MQILKIIKNATCVALSVILGVAGITVGKNNDAAAPYSWYCMTNTDGARPALPPEFEFIYDCGGAFIGKNEKEKVIYLTFDAGYENGNITKILDELDERGVSAAFFILAHLVKAEPMLVARMAEEGHMVCNHTCRHGDMTKYSDAGEFAAELKALEKLCRENAGIEISKYYRPPEGKFSKRNMEFATDIGYRTVFWSYAYADWDNAHQMNPEVAIKKLKDHTHNGMVVLLHPTSEVNASIIGEMLDYWIGEGYRFGSIAELW